MTICWFCQRIASSHIDANTALPKWARNHIQQCAACRESYESATDLAEQLSSSAKDQRRSLSPFLHTKIMSAVRSQENPEPQFERTRAGWAMAVGLVCLIAAGVVWVRQPSVPGQDALKTASAPPKLAFNVNMPSASQMDQWTKNLDAPLEQETKLVFRDATAAINTLARGFLPQDLFASSSETAQH